MPGQANCFSGFRLTRFLTRGRRQTDDINHQTAPPPYTPSTSAQLHPSDEKMSTPALSRGGFSSKVSPEVETIERLIDEISPDLRELSLKVHDHPELAFKEYKTAEVLTGFMEERGFKVSRSIHGIETAWSAEFVNSPDGKKGPTVGLQSEMDALPGIGHACGHNLIAISGVATALALAHGLKEHSVAGRILLLGTPAEEDKGGKIALLKAGAYDPMDVCLMLHPAPIEGLGKMLAVNTAIVEYFGHNAHAALAPWEGVNALDAAVLAYNSLSALRQQVHPENRMHGVIQGSEGWVQNVIPAYSKLVYGIRSPEVANLVPLRERVERCFKAAAEATGCKVKIEWSFIYYDLRNNDSLGKEYAAYLSERHGMEIRSDIPPLGSTDFGNVSYNLPSLHPIYRIPVKAGQGNHTPGFARSAATEEAHSATLRASKALAVTGWRAIVDGEFLEGVKRDFEEDRKRRKDPEAEGLREGERERAKGGKCGGGGGGCCGMAEFAHLPV